MYESCKALILRVDPEWLCIVFGLRDTEKLRHLGRFPKNKPQRCRMKIYIVENNTRQCTTFSYSFRFDSICSLLSYQTLYGLTLIPTFQFHLINYAIHRLKMICQEFLYILFVII